MKSSLASPRSYVLVYGNVIKIVNFVEFYTGMSWSDIHNVSFEIFDSVSLFNFLDDCLYHPLNQVDLCES